MKFLLLLPLFTVFPGLARAAISPEAVAILYNSAAPDGKALAESYCQARHIPEDHLIGLEMPTTQDISREDYDRWIRKPLRAEFSARKWWTLQNQNDLTLPASNVIKVLVTVRGVPLRIKPTPKPAPKPTPKTPPNSAPKTTPEPPKDPVSGRDEAAVDSELAMFGVEGVPVAGVLQNKYYKADKPFADANLPFLVLTARIDAPTAAICERMIHDTVEAEKVGLWGRAYVDIANKYPQGDQWLESIVKADLDTGIPTVVDRFNETFSKNYPLTDCAIYYGWYDLNLSGPFLNPHFQFRKGAVAMHLHSFSAQQLTDGTKNWSAGLLERGAAVTVGNVYEPYLSLTHDFGIIHQKLLEGYTWGEACWMAMPVTSWQGVVLGDPLYQPFRRLDGSGVKRDEDIEYRAVRAAAVEWHAEPTERKRQLEKAAERMKSGVLAESVGLELVEEKDFDAAVDFFRTARSFYTKPEDQLRQVFNIAAIDRTCGHQELAVLALRAAQSSFGTLPEAESLQAWIKILSPPPPQQQPAK